MFCRRAGNIQSVWPQHVRPPDWTDALQPVWPLRRKRANAVTGVAVSVVWPHSAFLYEKKLNFVGLSMILDSEKEWIREERRRAFDEEKASPVDA